MKDFDAKWQVSVARAREARVPETGVPFGFASRVAARGIAQPPLGLEVVFERLTVQLLTGALGFLAICAVLEVPHLRDAKPLQPGVENTVAQILWSL